MRCVRVYIPMKNLWVAHNLSWKYQSFREFYKVFCGWECVSGTFWTPRIFQKLVGHTKKSVRIQTLSTCLGFSRDPFSISQSTAIDTMDFESEWRMLIGCKLPIHRIFIHTSPPTSIPKLITLQFHIRCFLHTGNNDSWKAYIGASLFAIGRPASW